MIMTLFQCTCLGITLFVLYYYVIEGIQSRIHRLLPLLLGLIALYNFYQVFQCFLGENIIFSRLEDFLMLQIFFILVHYVMDFCYMKFPRWVEILLLVSVAGTSISIFFHSQDSVVYKHFFRIYTAVYLLGILLFGTYAYTKYSFSKKEHYVANMLYLALMIPGVSLLFRDMTKVPEGAVVAGSLVCTCVIVLYLMRTDQLTDTTFLIEENLFDTSEIATCLFDVDFYFLGANQAAKVLFSEKYALSERRKLYYEEVKQMASSPEKAYEMELNDRYYRCQLKPVSKKGQRKGYILSILDITKEKQEIQQMEQLKKAAETQTVLKSRFLAGMSHDLRSPLHAIIGISDILTARKDLTAKNRAFVLQIKDASNVLLGLVDDILVYSKIEAGKMTLEQKRYSFEKMIYELAQMCIVNLNQEPVDFSVDFLTECPKELIGDSLRIREILQNLFSNAVKFTEKGEIRCEISCNIQEQEKKVSLECRVKDTGIGIPQEKLDQIFMEYRTFADRRSKDGIGLGLSIVKQLAELMGGDVVAKSDGTSGTEIVVTMEQGLTDSVRIQPKHITKETLLNYRGQDVEQVHNEWIYPEAKVLVVDDMKINQQIFKELLRPWKIKVDGAISGREGIALAKEHTYQMIFLDQMMPELSGIETATILKQQCTTPLILLTADLSDETRKSAEECNLDGFLEKPISLTKLQEIISRCMPNQLRQRNLLDEEEMEGKSSISEKAYQKTLNAIALELEELEASLSQYAGERSELFRIKVHGIKGVTKQIGRNVMSRSAEIMEMAAKTENWNFIKENLEDFLLELRETVEDIRMELQLFLNEEDTLTQAGEEEVFSKEELWSLLHKAFEQYDAKKAENILEKLKRQELTKAEIVRYEKAKEACDAFDYESGSQLLEQEDMQVRQ